MSDSSRLSASSHADPLDSLVTTHRLDGDKRPSPAPTARQRSHDDTSTYALSLEVPSGGTGNRGGSLAISSVMNLPKSGPSLAALSSSLGATIPQTLKPISFSAALNLSSSYAAKSALAPSNKRSAPPPLRISEDPKTPHVALDGYLQAVVPAWSRWERHAETQQEDLTDPNLRTSPEYVALSMTSFKDTHESLRKALPRLDTVPAVFFSDNFTLADPQTFDIVTERSTPVTSGPSGPDSTHNQPVLLSIPDLATDQILHEKLSHYLDIVELHLVEEVSQRSSSFFSALGNLQALHAQSASCISQATALKVELLAVDRQVATMGLAVVQQTVRRKNLGALVAVVGRIHELWQAVAEAEATASGGDWETALRIIGELESVLTENVASPPSSNAYNAVSAARLHKIKALRGLTSRLSRARMSIARTLETEFAAVLLHEFRTKVAVYVSAHGQGWETSSGSGDVRAEARLAVQQRARTMVQGLGKADGLEQAVAGWRESVLKEIRQAVKAHLPDAAAKEVENEGVWSDGITGPSQSKLLTDDKSSISERTGILSKQLKEISHLDFMSVAERTYLYLLGCLNVLQEHAEAIRDLVITEGDPVPPVSPTSPLAGSSNTTLGASVADTAIFGDTVARSDALAIDLQEMVAACAELANTRFAKIMAVRTEVHAQLNLADFVAIFNVSWSFVVACEVIARRMIVGLRGVMVSQAKTFLQQFHQSRVSDSAKFVEEEKWAQVEIPAVSQEHVDLIIESAVEDPFAFRIPRITARIGAAQGSPSRTSRQIDIEGTSFYAVSAVLKTLGALCDYLKLTINCSLLTTDVMGKIVEYLKAFNSRTCQVVLGAGAMRSAGLKNITAKHLALASQALSVMINLIPYIRECLRRHLSPKQAVMLIDFDKLKRDYQEHQNEIHGKLIAIMADRLEVHAKTLSEIDWEQDRPPNEVSPYLESLMKEVSTLHKVLGRYLQSSTLEVVMMQVFSAVNVRLAEEFGQIDLQSETAKQRLLTDARYLSARLGDLKGLERGPAAAEWERLVESKTVAGRPSASDVSIAKGKASVGSKTDVVAKGVATAAAVINGQAPKMLEAAQTADDSTDVAPKADGTHFEPITDTQPLTLQAESRSAVLAKSVDVPAVCPPDATTHTTSAPSGRLSIAQRLAALAARGSRDKAGGCEKTPLPNNSLDLLQSTASPTISGSVLESAADEPGDESDTSPVSASAADGGGDVNLLSPQMSPTAARTFSRPQSPGPAVSPLEIPLPESPAAFTSPAAIPGYPVYIRRKGSTTANAKLPGAMDVVDSSLPLSPTLPDSAVVDEAEDQFL